MWEAPYPSYDASFASFFSLLRPAIWNKFLGHHFSVLDAIDGKFCTLLAEMDYHLFVCLES